MKLYVKLILLLFSTGLFAEIELSFPDAPKEDIIPPQKTAFAVFSRRQNKIRAAVSGTIPDFYRGIYISNRTARTKSKFTALQKEAKKADINTLVIDLQPVHLKKELLDEIKKEKFHPVARLVVFEGGLKTAQPDKNHMAKLKKYIQGACEAGFQDIQFDYIRYEDGARVGLSTLQRYKNITGVINELKGYVSDCQGNYTFGADIFGRVPFIEHDSIGQRVENFSENLDILYPMLYPSHFYGMKIKMNNPYQTVFDGVAKSLKRSRKGTRIIPYIQGFNMHVRGSGLTLTDYIKEQIKASYDSKGHGFIVWNAHNDYKATFKAIEKINNVSANP